MLSKLALSSSPFIIRNVKSSTKHLNVLALSSLNINTLNQRQYNLNYNSNLNQSFKFRSYSSNNSNNNVSSTTDDIVTNEIINNDSKVITSIHHSNIDLNSPYTGEIPIMNSQASPSSASSNTNEMNLSEFTAAQSEAIAQDPSMLEITGLPSFIEVCLHHLHTATGWSWMLIVPAFTLFIRSALLPFAVKQRINVMRILEIKPQLDAFKEKSQENRAKGISNYENSSAITALLKEKKCHPALSYVLPLANLPFFISAIIAMREMAATFPSMKTAGMLWFTDLSAMDPYYVLPILSSASYILVNELTLGNAPSLFLKIISWVARIMALMIIPFSHTIPSIVYFYWIPSSLFTLAQIFAFKSPTFCKMLGMPVFSNQPIIPASEGTKTKKYTPPPVDSKKKINRI